MNNPLKLPPVHWACSLPASMFYCIVGSALHDTLDSSRGVHAFPGLLAELFLAGSIGLWVLADARQRRRALPYDAGTFVFFAWMVVVPVYLFLTRGWRAFATLGWFLLLYLAAWLLGSIPYFLFAPRQ